MQKISLKEKMTKRKILNRVKTKMKFYRNMGSAKLKLPFASRIMRGLRERPNATELEGKINGKNVKGKVGK